MHLVIILLIVLVDQSSKYMAVKFFRDKEIDEAKLKIVTFKIIKNEGAALGILEKRKKLLLFINIILILAVSYYYMDLVMKNKGFLFILPTLFIIGGGLSNLIDRIRMRCVVDFFMFNIRNCPVFNIADLFIFIGAIMLQLVVLLKP